MENDILYIVVIVLGITVVIFSIFSRLKPKVQKQTRKDIIKKYEKEIKEALKGLEYDVEQRTTVKRLLIKKFNDELCRNIFFDQSEIKDILADLARI